MNLSMSAVFSLATCLIFASAEIRAENSKFSESDIAVFSGNEVISSGTSTTFEIGNELKFLRAPTFPITEKISVRIFSLPDSSNVPISLAEFEPCIVYWSTLTQVYFNADGPIKLFTVGPGWLDASNDGEVGSRRYLVVFEKGDGDGLRMVRLHRDHIKSYFSRGIAILVQPERSYSNSEAMSLAAAQVSASKRALQEAQENVSRYRCYLINPAKTTDAQFSFEGTQNGTGSNKVVHAMNDCESEIFLR